MDAFFASVEQRDNPDLRGKPIVVGSSGLRGVVAAASYEAREFGVYSAMPSVTAARLCPHLIFVKHRFEVYKEVSQQIRAIFREYTDLVEPLSLDEAFLDVTENKKGISSAIQIAKEIKARIKEETGLTASAGVSINKFLAKTASDIHKPDGLTYISPERAEEFLEQLPIKKFFGVGKKTAEKMHKVGIYTGADLKQWTELELAQKFGKMGRFFYRIVRAQDTREVRPTRRTKSVSAESTFYEDLETATEMLPVLEKLSERVATRLQKSQLSGRTVILKIKYHNFVLRTRSKSGKKLINEAADIYKIAKKLLYRPEFPQEAVRLLGLGVGNIHHPEDDLYPRQLEFDFEY